MNKIIKSLVIISLSLMIVGCSAVSFKETSDYKVDDLKTLIDKTYEKYKPEFTTDTVEVTDLDMMLSRTGLQDSATIEAMVASDPMMMTTPYTFVLIKVDKDADVEKMKQEIIDNINLNYWVCVFADVAYVNNYGNVIAVVMGKEDVANEVYKAFTKATGKLGKKLEKINDGSDLGNDELGDIITE